MSARYKISNRNIYGFRTNMYQMMFLLIPLLIALSLLAEFVLGPVLYGFYQKGDRRPPPPFPGLLFC